MVAALATLLLLFEGRPRSATWRRPAEANKVPPDMFLAELGSAFRFSRMPSLMCRVWTAKPTQMRPREQDTEACAATEQLASLRRVCSKRDSTTRATAAAGALGARTKNAILELRVVKKILSGFFKGNSGMKSLIHHFPTSSESATKNP